MRQIHGPITDPAGSTIDSAAFRFNPREFPTSTQHNDITIISRLLCEQARKFAIGRHTDFCPHAPPCSAVALTTVGGSVAGLILPATERRAGCGCVKLSIH